jgi:hypothetical protein
MSTKHTPGPWEVYADRTFTSHKRFWLIQRYNRAAAFGRETLITPKGSTRRFFDEAKAVALAAKLNAVGSIGPLFFSVRADGDNWTEVVKPPPPCPTCGATGGMHYGNCPHKTPATEIRGPGE